MSGTSSTTPAPSGRVEWANALRGVAALAVLAYHFGVVFWMRQDAAAGLARHEPLYAVDEGAPAFARVLTRLPVELGAFGVAAFFLVSGFVIAMSLERYGRRGFLVGRVMRVLPTYAAGYLVTCAVILAMSDPAGELSVLGVLVGAVPGLGLVTGVPVASDGIAWTLIIELVFYGVCLVAFRSLTRRWWVPLVVAAGAVIVQLTLPPPAAILGSALGGTTYVILLACPFIPFMLVGVVLSAAGRGRMSRRGALTSAAVLLAVHTVLLSTSEILVTPLEYRLTFVGTAVAFGALWAFGGRWRGHRVTSALADISYPLYVVHPVLGYALIATLTGNGVSPVVGVLVATVAALGTSWILHRVVEVPTHVVGRRWARRLSGDRTVVTLSSVASSADSRTPAAPGSPEVSAL